LVRIARLFVSLLFPSLIAFQPVALSNVHKSSRFQIIELSAFNRQVESLSIIDIKAGTKDILWVLTVDGLYRFNGTDTDLLLTKHQMDLGSDLNIYKTKLVNVGDDIGITDGKLLVTVDTKNLGIDFSPFKLETPARCDIRSTDYVNIRVSHDDETCVIDVRNFEHHAEIALNDTVVTEDSQFFFATSVGLIHHAGRQLTIFDASNSAFDDNEVTSLEITQSGALIIGTYRGLYIGFPGPEFIDRQELRLDANDQIAALAFDATTDSLFILTEDSVLGYDISGKLKWRIDLQQKVMSLIAHQNTLVIGGRNQQHCIISLSPSFEARICKPLLNEVGADGLITLSPVDSSKILGANLHGEIFLIDIGAATPHISFISKLDFPITKLISKSGSEILAIGSGQLTLLTLKKQNFEFLIKIKKTIKVGKSVLYDALPTNKKIFLGTSGGLTVSDIDLLAIRSAAAASIGADSRYNEVYAINSTDTHLAFTTASSLWYSDLANPTDFKQLRIRNLFPNFEFEFGISGKTPDGKLVFGGSGGLLFWDGETGVSGDSPPLLNFTGFSVNGESLDLTIAAEEITSVELSHKAYHFKADFAVMDYINPSQNRYEYKLEGFDTNWVDGEVNGSATYTNLPPGEYKLRVRGANSLGVWSDEEITLDLTVNPAWWRTWWAYTAYLCLVIWGLVLAKRHYDTVKLHLRAVVLSKEMVDASEDQMAIIERRNSTLTRSVENQTRLLKRFMQDIELIAPAYVGADLTNWLREMSEANERLILGHYITEVSCEAIGNLALEIVSQETRQRGLQCIGLTESPSPYISSDLTLRIYALVVELARWSTAHLRERRISRIALTLSFFEIGNELGIRVSCSHSLRFGSDPMGNARIRLLRQNLKAQIKLASEHHAVEVMIDTQAL